MSKKSIEIVSLLKRYYPDAHCALNHKNPFELLIATILSAQCTDERVNQVTPNLFKKFPNPKKMANAELIELEHLIRSTGFYHNKAKNINLCSRKLVEEFQGEIPLTVEELVLLPGVGRKTANVVLGNAFHIASGVVVDTHVSRLSYRFGWTMESDPIKIEKKLMKIIEKKDWIMISHWMIFHGRSICKARTPKCHQCFLFDLCPQKGVK